MNPVETIAIAKQVGEQAEKDARKQVCSGTHSTDFWLHVSGDIDVGDDYCMLAN